MKFGVINLMYLNKGRYNMYFYLFIVVAIFAIGDLMGVLTKAKVSSVFVVMMLFLGGFMSGVIPADIIDQAGLTQIGRWSAAFIIFHMGTMINMKELINEWRTVVTAIISMLVAVMAIFAVIPIIGAPAAYVSIPIVNGGIVATQIMTAAATEKGLALVAALGTIVYATQKFFGTPFASYFGMKEAAIIVDDFRKNKELIAKGQAPKAAEVVIKNTFYERNKKFYGNFVNLGITALFAWISSELGKATPVSYSIWALLLGAVVCQLGLVPEKILDVAKSSGLLNMAVFASIIPSLASIKLEDIGTLSFQIIVIFGVTMVALYLAFGVLPLWKIIGSKNLALGVSVAQLLGFPATYLISNEIAVAASETDEEREAIMDAIMPKYVVAGLATVTSISILMAGIFEKLL